MEIKGKSLREIRPNTNYNACSFYVDDKEYDATNCKFHNYKQFTKDFAKNQDYL
ncbi:hypothetical protein [Candidatus Uabimicrobium sp. HlEnr_7]|uniref:hypothetical protein n=1 Tax=Candidatus Uabimicrobium helgolandensis TaxID=3095367 RepID=UPI0035576FB1